MRTSKPFLQTLGLTAAASLLYTGVAFADPPTPPPGGQMAKPTAAPADGAAIKKGWWIRVRADKQEASSISFQVGTSEENRKAWRQWQRGQPMEFDLGEKFRHVPTLYLSATSGPKDQESWFCVMYGTKGVKKVSFDDHEEETVKQTDSDADCNL